MNLLILCLLFAVVFSRVIYPEDVDGSSHLNNHLHQFPRFCTKPCKEWEECVEGFCYAKKCKTDDECGTWAFCWTEWCGSFCSDVQICPPPSICIHGKCGIPFNFNQTQSNRRSFSTGCAAPCGPGTTCMMGNCVRDAG
ncbi:hypothetical protein CAEBREN_13646 [Caenorhabditis brenneri]|uniref:WAP domain-containing protein n=1 Tax=Caenorhabditis brenneri TaxID=135651 RepID=G0NZI8_CAEBE|nr:hypothetical protein CAEBREN_13646 [Caenorhabditis brenneri]